MPGKGISEAAIAATLAGAILSMLAVVAFGAAKADAYVYWGDFQNGRIGRAANDGTDVNDSFVAEAGAGPGAVAVDAGHVYWADQNGESIGRANIDGSGVNSSFITGVGKANGLAVNGSSIYWSTTAGTVGRAAINGTGKNVNFISGPSGPTLSCGVAVDSGHVYWGDIGNFGAPAYIGRAGLDGNNVEAHFVTIPGTAFPCGVAVNAANIYWTEPGFLLPNGTRIGRANINGGGPDPSIIGEASAPCGIAVFGLQLFWANSGSNAIGRANTDLTGVNQSFIPTGGSQICGVAVDALQPPPPQPKQPEGSTNPTPGGGPGMDVTPPNTTIAGGPGKKLAQGKARFSLRSNEDGSTFTCKLDGKKPVGCTSPKRYSGLRPGKHVFKVWATDRAGNKAATPATRRFTVPATA
jgi:streptogramin lyase